jgi:hypothetical protein
VVRYQLAVLGLVRVAVYDLLGREVAVLVNGRKAAGVYGVEFDARGLSDGVYFCRIESEGFTQVRKVLLLK